MTKTPATLLKENSEDIESFDADIEALQRRNIKLEAYTKRDNIRIFNIKEEADENTDELVRNLFVTELEFGTTFRERLKQSLTKTRFPV